jgi:hypothetical protein
MFALILLTSRKRRYSGPDGTILRASSGREQVQQTTRRGYSDFTRSQLGGASKPATPEPIGVGTYVRDAKEASRDVLKLVRI